MPPRRLFKQFYALVLGCGVIATFAQPVSGATPAVECSPKYGAPPIVTIAPFTMKPHCFEGTRLSYDQEGVTRYACLNWPAQATVRNPTKKWPLVIYLHGSLTTPDSLYLLGHELVKLHHTYVLSDKPEVAGFIILSPEGRLAQPWASDTVETGHGFHWDEWHRNPQNNLDALAIDHFLDEVMATGKADPTRVYVFGWSNGAYMAALYGTWRSNRIAAIAQYAGADPWNRHPCPVSMTHQRKMPILLLRNLCDALVPCETTNDWISTLSGLDWPFEYRNLDLTGGLISKPRCASACPKSEGLYEHFRWPQKKVFQLEMLPFLKNHPLP